MNFIQVISEELNLRAKQVEASIALLDEGKTIPFIARYRKEATQALDEVQIHSIQERLHYLRHLEERKTRILEAISEQGKLTEELRQKINETRRLSELEDLYLPYKAKKRTRAMIAKEKGLEKLALLFWEQEKSDLSIDDLCEDYIDFDKDLFTKVDILKGVNDILAELISEDAEYRKWIRNYTFKNGALRSKEKKDSEESDFEIYADYSESLNSIPAHRVLAILRGERKKALSVKIDVDAEAIIHFLSDKIIFNQKSIWADYLKTAITDSYKRLISPAIEREIRQDLTEKAEHHAIEVFGENLKNLLLQAPLPNKVILAIDPGFRSGSKISVIDKNGLFLASETIFPHPPQNQREKAKECLKDLIQSYQVDVIAIGNGTASRESEQLIADLLKEIGDQKLAYIIVNEAGASVYSASEVAREEFPDMDVSIRGAVSIARRLQDPLAELVKIDPKSIGVGLYQHDVDQKKLAEKLSFIIEYCVNHVGVDLNTASASLLEHVSGLTKRSARNIITEKEKRGAFRKRSELLKVSGIGQSAYEQCAGFLRIANAEDPLDNTAIHPESYSAAQALITRFQINDVFKDAPLLKQKITQVNTKELADDLDIGLFTLTDILENLQKVGRDPREGLEKPILRSDVLSLSDLSEGMYLKGTVRNVVDFGAFVDVGLKNDGLVHISQLSDRFVKNPSDIVSVGDIVDVRILSIDTERGRVGLSMKKN